VVDRTAPVVSWLAPQDSIEAFELSRLNIQCNVVEWQGIGRDSVTIEWYVPFKPQAHGSIRLRLAGFVTKGDSLRYGSTIDLTDYVGVELTGGDEVVFSAIATDNAGNRTRSDSIAVLPITASPRWYHCSRGRNEGYINGRGIHETVGPYDAWCYVPRNTIIFDSVAIQHYYNGEVSTPVADAIAQANVHAQANQNIGILDVRSSVKAHSFTMVDKNNVQKRYDPNGGRVQLELYFDDLRLTPQQLAKLKLFKLDDYQVVQRIDGTKDTIFGSGEWVPIDTGAVLNDSSIVFDVDLSFVPEGYEDNGLRYGLGIFTIMTYTPPKELISSLISYPNPFNPLAEPTRISYVLKEKAKVTVSIYSLIGDLVWSGTYKEGQPGGMGSPTGHLNEVVWDGYNDMGRMVGNGGYVVKITAETKGAKVTIKRKLGVLK
jgi:hypothetical protein